MVLNGTATFTIRVTNTGQTALSNVTVTDALAPNCNRAAGSIPTLQPGTGTNSYFEYTCTLTVSVDADFTNVAVTTGQPSRTNGTPLPNAPTVTDDDPSGGGRDPPGDRHPEDAGPAAGAAGRHGDLHDPGGEHG